jgi:hypothetical protein
MDNHNGGIEMPYSFTWSNQGKRGLRPILVYLLRRLMTGPLSRET